MRPAELLRAGPNQRILRDSARWFSEGREAREKARRARRCVECGGGLVSRRSPYCSRACQWAFHGRYFWDAARRVVLRRDRYTCRWCGVRGRRREMEVDHVVEIARGGAPLSYENLQTLCKACHRAKTVRFLRGRPRLGARPVLNEDELPDWFPA